MFLLPAWGKCIESYLTSPQPKFSDIMLVASNSNGGDIFRPRKSVNVINQDFKKKKKHSLLSALLNIIVVKTENSPSLQRMF